MDQITKIKLRRSECRERLNELSGLETLEAEHREELDKLTLEFGDLEKQYRAALILADSTNGKPDGEKRELESILKGVDVGAILQASLDQRSTDGKEKEIQDHFGLAGNQFPIELLEERAVTPAPSDVGRDQMPIIPQIFPDSVSSFLGVSQPTVAVGEKVYTVLSTGATVSTPGKGESVAESTGAFTAYTLAPKRAQTSFFWNLEDQHTLRGMDSALRSNLRSSLSSKLDAILLNDSGDGLLGSGLTQPSDPTSVENYQTYKAAVTSQVDGLYASSPGGVRVLLGAETYRHSAGLYRGTTTDNESGYAVMSRLAGGVRVSSHVPAASSNIQGAIAARATGALHAVMPLWRSATFIPDSISKAASGQIVLTCVLLYGLKVVRSAGFAPLKFKIA